LGNIQKNESYIGYAIIDEVLDPSLVDAMLLEAAKFKVVVDRLNSTAVSPYQKPLKGMG